MNADPLSLESLAVLVLCLNVGEHTPSIAEEKAKGASKWLGFVFKVWFWSALALTLNQRVPRWS